jgi:hypothetical protein
MAAAVLFLRERKRYDAGKQKAKYDVASPYRGNDRAAAAAKYKSREKDKGAKRSIQIKIHVFS